MWKFQIGNRIDWQGAKYDIVDTLISTHYLEKYYVVQYCSDNEEQVVDNEIIPKDKVESECTLYEEDITGVWKYSVGDVVCNPNGINMPKFKITGYVYYNGKSCYALNNIDDWSLYCDVPKLVLENNWKLWRTN